MTEAPKSVLLAESPGSNRSADIAAGLLAAALWALLTGLRIPVGRAAVFAASLGCASLGAVPVVALSRWLRGSTAPDTSYWFTSFLALVPLSAFGAVLKVHTHHRALGAVAFACGAAVLVVVTHLVVRRVLGAPSHGAPSRGAKAALIVGCAASALWTLSALVGAASPSAVRSAALDCAAGVLSAGALTFMPLTALPRGLLRLAPSLALGAVVAGIVVVWKNPSVSAALCEGAPATLGIVGIFRCP